METLLLFIAAGLLAGFLAGLLGIGGGLVVVPVLFFYFGNQPELAPYAMHLALGSSLAFIVLNSGAAAWIHVRLEGVQWREARDLSPGLVAGGLVGAAVAGQLSTPVLARAFGIFLLAMAALILFGSRLLFPGGGRRWHSAAAGLPIGGIAALVGVGGGVMVVPWLLSRGYRAAQAVATSSICTIVVAVVGAAGYVLFADAVPLSYTTGYVHWPAVLGIAVTAFFTARLGARLAHHVDQRNLRKLFALLLVVVALRLLI